jgi:hypothetical protein
LLDQTRAELFYLFENTTGEVMKFGQARRNPTPLQRLAIMAHDGSCIFPGRHEPPDRCDVHHLNEWLRDTGITDVAVLGLFCRPQNRHLHLNELVAVRKADASITIRSRATAEVVAAATRKVPPAHAA